MDEKKIDRPARPIERPARRGAGDQPDVTPKDVAIMDKIWDEIGRQDRAGKAVEADD